jgi:hypothetical protein
MITVKIKQELIAAVNNAKDYTKGKNIGKLRVAFDGMCSQICYSLFCKTPMNRVMARKLLNDAMRNQNPEENLDLVHALHAALLTSDHTLFLKDYIDHTVSIEKFIIDELQAVVRCLP